MAENPHPSPPASRDPAPLADTEMALATCCTLGRRVKTKRDNSKRVAFRAQRSAQVGAVRSSRRFDLGPSPTRVSLLTKILVHGSMLHMRDCFGHDVSSRCILGRWHAQDCWQRSRVDA